MTAILQNESKLLQLKSPVVTNVGTFSRKQGCQATILYVNTKCRKFELAEASQFWDTAATKWYVFHKTLTEIFEKRPKVA